ncbi:MAG: LysM peptidoglycan-binding domain-containing protein [Pseudonocardiaceae bacterium]|nr:LysM peptidoglycan-binding domain-containing protein [Pseudonocardiaceae bacterium]
MTTSRVLAATKALTGLIGLAVLLVGVPTALIALIGNPVPRLSLTQPWTDTAVLQLLACLVWLIWAHLLWHVIVEAVTAARGAAFPKTRWFSRPQQLLARTLIAWVMLTTVAIPSLTAKTPHTSHAAHEPVPTIAVAAAAGPATSDGTTPTTDMHGRGVASHRTPASTVTDTNATVDTDKAPDGDRYIIVQRGDSLWGLAERHLGDGLRWRDIYELNKDHTQSDGTRLRDADLIQPGWRLRLPADATSGDQRKPPSTRPAKPPAQDRATPPQTPRPSQTSSSPTQESTATATPPSNSPSVSSSPSSTDSRSPESRMITLPSGAFVGVTFAVAIGAAVTLVRLHRRRRYRAGIDPITAPTGPEMSPTARRLRRTYLSQVNDQHHSDDESTSAAAAPAVPRATDATPIAARDGQEVRVALHTLGGLGVDGPGADDAVRALLTASVASGNQETIEVVIPQPDLRYLLDTTDGTTPVPVPPSVTITATLPDALHHLETEVIHRTRLLDRYDDTDLDTFRKNHPDEEPLPPLILITQASEQHTPRLHAALTLGRAYHVGAVILGPWPTGTSCHLDGDGQVTDTSGSGAKTLDHSQFFHLTATDAADLLGVLAAANGNEPTQTETAVTDELPDGSNDEQSDDKDLPAPETDSSEPPPHQPPVGLAVLGPIRVYAGPTEIPTGLRNLSRELLAYLASHDDGVPLHHTLADIWRDTDPDPAAVQFHTVTANIRKVLRDATALHDADFVVHAGGRYRLNPQLIDVDLWRFTHHIKRAHAATSDTETVQALTDAVDTFQGEFIDGYTYEWAEPIRENLHRAAVDACIRLATRHENHDNPEQAVAVLDRAISLDPYNEDLYQRAIRLLDQLGRTDAIRGLYKHLQTRLSELDVDPTPATEQLVRIHLSRKTAMARAKAART